MKRVTDHLSELRKNSVSRNYNREVKNCLEERKPERTNAEMIFLGL